MDTNTTQSFVPVKELRNGVIVRDDGNLCAVLLVSAMNYDLKSYDERKNTLLKFQNLLNSLEVGIEILVQSRNLNIRPYVEFLKRLHKKQTTELLRLQTQEYINFIKDFTNSRRILTKRFFVIIPYSPFKQLKTGFSFFKNDSNTKKYSFEEENFQLTQRVSFIQNNIRALGLRAVQLGTEEVTELLYQTFNPGDTQTPPNI